MSLSARDRAFSMSAPPPSNNTSGTAGKSLPPSKQPSQSTSRGATKSSNVSSNGVTSEAAAAGGGGGGPTSSRPVQRQRGATLKERAVETKRKFFSEKVLSLDIFAFEPKPKAKAGDQVSFRGFAATILVIIVVLVNVALTSVRFVQDVPAVSTQSAPTKDTKMPFVPIAAVFRKNDAARVPVDIFYDPSYFTFVFTLSIAYEQDRRPRNNTVIPTVPCNVSSWAGWVGEEAYCPEYLPHIWGRYQSPEYAFFRIDVTMCSNATSNVTCKPVEEITAMIASGRFNILVHYQDGQGGYAESYNYFINPSFWSLYEQLHQRYIVRTSPNLITRFSETEEQYILPVYEKFYSFTRYSLYLTVYFRLNNLETVEHRNVQTILDLVGSWWAFYGAAAAFFALHCARYNEKKFYKKHPHWDEVEDEVFEAPSRRQQRLGDRSLSGGQSASVAPDIRGETQDPTSHYFSATSGAGECSVEMTAMGPDAPSPKTQTPPYYTDRQQQGASPPIVQSRSSRNKNKNGKASRASQNLFEDFGAAEDRRLDEPFLFEE